MLVVVYLNEAKYHTVVPEHFYSLNEKNLKNSGMNSNQNRLIYFSKDCYDKLEKHDVEVVKQMCQSKFHLPVTKIFPLPNIMFE